MTKLDAQTEDRMIELLADRALGSLAPDDAAELARLLRQYPQLDTDVLDMAAAALTLACEKTPFEPLPQALADKVHRTLTDEMAKTVVDPPGAMARPAAPKREPDARAPARAPAKSGKPRVSAVTYIGWAAAAVFFLAAAGTWRMTHPSAVPLANERARIMAEPDSVKTVFAALKDPAAAVAQGDVVWSTREQRGFMRFKGLAANPRDKWVYQLWIFDADQDDKFPIDGGVFDVDPSNGDVLVPIQAKIHVNKPTQFVVTIEKPGGVVVSKRERVAMAAKI